jgi:hypothetical protein
MMVMIEEEVEEVVTGTPGTTEMAGIETADVMTVAGI